MKIGSLFSGVAGLDRAVEAVTGATPAWFVEFDAAPSKVLERHYPGVPNYGDVTTVDWSSVEPVDILTAGYPCQPCVLRPRLVVLENVAGHLTLGGSTVVGALTGLGYDARWGVVRASDAGAPHRRARLFIVAAADTCGGQLPRPTDRLDGLPVASERALLPTPVVNDMGNGKTPDDWDGWTADMQDRHSNGNGHGKSLAIEAQRADYGQYAPAIARWENILGEPAPPPTIQGRNGPRLNPDLPRWMMGFPAGWLEGLTPSQQLKAAGNAVCQQQAELALRILLGAA